MPEPTSQPTITSKALPPNQQPGAVTSSPAVAVPQQTPYDQIVAKPLRAPNFINLKPKNPNLCLYWGNRAVGDDESHLRYDELLAMGFVPAKPEQVISPNGQPCPPSLQRDGRIMYGDLILLIMPRNDYLGALKYNAQSAEMRVRRFGSSQSTPEEGRGETASALGDITRSRAAREGKIKPYIPPLVETESLTADNSDIKPSLG